MARMGNHSGNIMMVSFSKKMKYEEVNLCKYDTLEDVVTRLPCFIEEVYNTGKTPFVAGLPSYQIKR